MDIVSQLREIAKEHHIPIILDDSLNFLIDFVKQNNFQNILEIGTAIGYSGSLMLDVSANSKLLTVEKDENRAAVAKQTFEITKLQNRVTLVVGDAKKVIENLNEQFDFIFLDGPKGQYFRYLPYLLKNLQVGGYIFADNVYFKNMVKMQGIIPKKKRTIVNNLRTFLDMVKNDENLETKVLEIGDGIAIIKKIK